MMEKLLRRYCINQPSTLQPLHHLHRSNVLALPGTSETVTAYFTQGSIISTEIPRVALSPGWFSST